MHSKMICLLLPEHSSVQDARILLPDMDGYSFDIHRLHAPVRFPGLLNF